MISCRYSRYSYTTCVRCSSSCKPGRSLSQTLPSATTAPVLLSGCSPSSDQLSLFSSPISYRASSSPAAQLLSDFPRASSLRRGNTPPQSHHDAQLCSALLSSAQSLRAMKAMKPIPRNMHSSCKPNVFSSSLRSAPSLLSSNSGMTLKAM